MNIPDRFEAYILVNSDFYAVDTVICITELRHRGIGAAIVGLQPGLVTDLYGLVIRPDFFISDIENLELTPSFLKMIILSGKENSQSKILLDPRVHNLVHRTVTSGGVVGCLSKRIPSILKPTLPPQYSKHIFLKGTKEIVCFADELANYILVNRIETKIH